MINTYHGLLHRIRKHVSQSLLALLIFVGPPAFAYADKCTANTSVHSEVAASIAHGHAFTKHSADFVKGDIKAGLAFPDDTITDEDKFTTFLTKILDLPTVSKTLINRRSAYWDSRTGTVIIYNPVPADCGTAFRPDLGKAYFDGLQ